MSLFQNKYVLQNTTTVLYTTILPTKRSKYARGLVLDIHLLAQPLFTINIIADTPYRFILFSPAKLVSPQKVCI